MTGDFYGLPTCSLSNAHLCVEYLAEAGPRLVRLFVTGSAAGRNLLAELPEMAWPTPFGDYHVRGGHRLWHAPEAMPRTYVPDDHGLTITEVPGGVELRQPAEAPTGLRKSLIIHLQPDQPVLTLTHCITNEGLWPAQLSPWAITQLCLGGVVVLPQPGRSADGNGLHPDRHLVLWPYARWNDPRLNLHDDYWLFQAQSRLPPCKFGYLNAHGWVGYLWEDVFFLKGFQPQVERLHPDQNCNVEVYCNDQFVELETVAPLARLEPGEMVSHVERWRFVTGLHADSTHAGVQVLMRMIQQAAASESADTEQKRSD